MAGRTSLRAIVNMIVSILSGFLMRCDYCGGAAETTSPTVSIPIGFSDAL